MVGSTWSNEAIVGDGCCGTGGSPGIQRMVYGVWQWCMAVVYGGGVWHVAFNIWRTAHSVWHAQMCVCMSEGMSEGMEVMSHLEARVGLHIKPGTHVLCGLDWLTGLSLKMGTVQQTANLSC